MEEGYNYGSKWVYRFTSHLDTVVNLTPLLHTTRALSTSVKLEGVQKCSEVFENSLSDSEWL